MSAKKNVSSSDNTRIAAVAAIVTLFISTSQLGTYLIRILSRSSFAVVLALGLCSRAHFLGYSKSNHHHIVISYHQQSTKNSRV